MLFFSWAASSFFTHFRLKGKLGQKLGCKLGL